MTLVCDALQETKGRRGTGGRRSGVGREIKEKTHTGGAGFSRQKNTGEEKTVIETKNK